MANINEVFGGNGLKAEDLKGTNPRVTIEDAELKKFDDGNKIVLRLRGKDKVLICNKTNASIIAEVLGSNDTDDWIGHAITLTTRKVEYAGKLVPAIRVMLEEPAPRRPAPAAERRPAPQPQRPPEPDDSGLEDSDVPF